MKKIIYKLVVMVNGEHYKATDYKEYADEIHLDKESDILMDKVIKELYESEYPKVSKDREEEISVLQKKISALENAIKLHRHNIYEAKREIESDANSSVREMDINIDRVPNGFSYSFDKILNRYMDCKFEDLSVAHGNGLSLEWLREQDIISIVTDEYNTCSYIINISNGVFAKANPIDIGGHIVYMLEGYIIPATNRNWKILATVQKKQKGLFLIRLSNKQLRLISGKWLEYNQNIDISEEDIMSTNIDKKSLVEEWNIQRVMKELM